MERRKHIFNLIDFIIILIILFAAFVFVYALLGNDPLEVISEKSDISYSVLVKSDEAQGLCVGDDVFTKKGKDAGKITDIYEADGITVVKIEAEAYKVGTEMLIKGQRLAQGEPFLVKLSENETTSAYVQSVEAGD